MVNGSSHARAEMNSKAAAEAVPRVNARKTLSGQRLARRPILSALLTYIFLEHHQWLHSNHDAAVTATLQPPRPAIGEYA